MKLIKSIHDKENYVVMSSIAVRFYKVESKRENQTEHKYFGSFEKASEYFSEMVAVMNGNS